MLQGVTVTAVMTKGTRSFYLPPRLYRYLVGSPLGKLLPSIPTIGVTQLLHVARLMCVCGHVFPKNGYAAPG